MPTGQKLPKRKVYSSGPWLGVYDTVNAPVAREEYLLGASNLWPDPQIAPAWGSRLGWQRIDDAITGVSSGTVGQGLMTFYAASGSASSFVMVSGKIFAVAGSGATTDVTPAAVVSVSDSAHRIYGLQYDGTLIVSDGVNRPWKVTSAMTANPLTGAYLTDAAGKWYGRPVVYYGKVFAINGTSRTAIEWSEENDADNGYDVNIWELTQSNPKPLIALHATNDALYYFRAESIGAIRGAVTTDFQTDGVHDGISNTTGTLSPDSVVSAGRYVYFADRHGRPCRIAPGLGVEDIWRAAGESLGSGIAESAAVHISAAYDPESGTVVFAHPTTGSTALSLFVFDAESGRYLGQWTMPTGFSTSQFRAMGLQPYLNEGVITLHVLDQLGNLWGLTPRKLATYADNAGSALDVAHIIEFPPLGYDKKGQKQFDLLTANVRSPGVVPHTHSLSYRTPNQATYSTGQTVVKNGIVAGLTQQCTWGVNALGRWLQPRIGNTSQLQLGYLDVEVEAALVDERPGAS
jgi:hypothetical protein